MAFALDGTSNVFDPHRPSGDPSDKGGDRISMLMIAAAVDESKAIARQPAAAPSASAKAEAGPQAEFPDEEEDTLELCLPSP